MQHLDIIIQLEGHPQFDLDLWQLYYLNLLLLIIFLFMYTIIQDYNQK